MYDDYVESRPGAAKEFESWLNTAYATTRTGAEGDPSYISNASQNPSAASGSQQQQRGTLDVRIPLRAPAPIYDPHIQQRNQTSTIINCVPENRWLLICAKVKNKPVGLEHFDVTSVLSDQQLFRDLKDIYHRARASWIRFLPLRTVIGIRFVRVGADIFGIDPSTELSIVRTSHTQQCRY